MFFQHKQSVEKQIRNRFTFALRCMERPADPGNIRRVPHTAQMMCPAYASIPLTMFEFDLTITPSFCFIRNLRHRYNVQLRPTEADLYLFLHLMFEYIIGDMRKMYKREKVVITSALPHFAEVAVADGFRISAKEDHSWRAIRCMQN